MKNITLFFGLVALSSLIATAPSSAMKNDDEPENGGKPTYYRVCRVIPPSYLPQVRYVRSFNNLLNLTENALSLQEDGTYEIKKDGLYSIGYDYFRDQDDSYDIRMNSLFFYDFDDKITQVPLTIQDEWPKGNLFDLHEKFLKEIKFRDLSTYSALRNAKIETPFTKEEHFPYIFNKLKEKGVHITSFTSTEAPKAQQKGPNYTDSWYAENLADQKSDAYTVVNDTIYAKPTQKGKAINAIIESLKFKESRPTQIHFLAYSKQTIDEILKAREIGFLPFPFHLYYFIEPEVVARSKGDIKDFYKKTVPEGFQKHEGLFDSIFR